MASLVEIYARHPKVFTRPLFFKPGKACATWLYHSFAPRMSLPSTLMI